LDNHEGIFQQHSTTHQSNEKNFDTSQMLLMHAPAPGPAPTTSNAYEQQPMPNYSSKFHPLQMTMDNATVGGGQFKGGMGGGGNTNNNPMRMP
jgi:hypothetical protein